MCKGIIIINMSRKFIVNHFYKFHNCKYLYIVYKISNIYVYISYISHRIYN